MSSYEPISPWETTSIEPESSRKSEPAAHEGPHGETAPSPSSPGSSSNWPVSASMAGPAFGPKVRPSPSIMRRGLFAAAALVGSATGLFDRRDLQVPRNQSPPAASQDILDPEGKVPTHDLDGCQGSSGMVGNVATSSFIATTSTVQLCRLTSRPSTKYAQAALASKSAKPRSTRHRLRKRQRPEGHARPRSRAADLLIHLLWLVDGAGRSVPTQYSDWTGTIFSATTPSRDRSSARGVPGGIVYRVVSRATRYDPQHHNCPHQFRQSGLQSHLHH